MREGHNFSFSGGDILSRIGAAWFVSYAYYSYIDKNHVNWEFGITIKSLNSRRSKYNNSSVYHKDWLNEWTNVKQVDSICENVI